MNETTGSPLYALLRKSLGAPTECKVEGTSVVILFPKAGRLTVSADETLEHSSFDAVLPASAAVSRAKAIDTMRAVEKSAAAPSGCGIAWPAPNRKSNEIEAEGTSCNCKASIGLSHEAAVHLFFSLAC